MAEYYPRASTHMCTVCVTDVVTKQVQASTIIADDGTSMKSQKSLNILYPTMRCFYNYRQLSTSVWGRSVAGIVSKDYRSRSCCQVMCNNQSRPTARGEWGQWCRHIEPIRHCYCPTVNLDDCFTVWYPVKCYSLIDSGGPSLLFLLLLVVELMRVVSAVRLRSSVVLGVHVLSCHTTVEVWRTEELFGRLTAMSLLMTKRLQHSWIVTLWITVRTKCQW